MWVYVISYILFTFTVLGMLEDWFSNGFHGYTRTKVVTKFRLMLLFITGLIIVIRIASLGYS